MLYIEPQIFVQDNTINEMAQTNSHRFNTHVKRLSLSASVVFLLSHAALVESSHNISIIYCNTILPPVHSKLMSHYQLSNFAIHGLEHSETGMNS